MYYIREVRILGNMHYIYSLILFLCAWEKAVINYRNLIERGTVKLYKFPTGRRDKETVEEAVLSERAICMQLQWETASSTHGTSSEALLRMWLACHVRRLTLLSVSFSLQALPIQPLFR